jgi:hypothetical protein
MQISNGNIYIEVLTPLDNVTGWTDLKDVLITEPNYFSTRVKVYVDPDSNEL